MTMKPFILFLISILSLSLSAQEANDSVANYEEKPGRALQYYPDNGDFVCVNGKNRFTRALYGSHTDYRIETSDVPIFAIFKSKNCRSLRFFITVGNTTMPLDSVSYCEARYGKGMRRYVLKDEKWGREAKVLLDVVAQPETEGAVFRFRQKGISKATITSRVCNIAYPKLHRNGDLGVEKPGCFEPSPSEENLVVESMEFEDEAIALLDFHTISFSSAKSETFAKAQQAFQTAQSHYEALCSRIEFKTPDPYLNTLGSALMLAADGVWDGTTWLHGAIGWRMPLAGWRAGYLGDVLGWNDRAVSHFDAYANSQVTNVPVTIHGASQDTTMNLARAEKKWGTEMYSNGYICRNPNRNDQMHHYDMNLNYIDELLWHFEYDADTAYMRKMWPVLTRHLAWEKLNFDSDNDHLYDAYCCIWASDALYYSDGAVTHSSAYNYRANLLAAKIARLLGENPEPYQKEAEAIQKAMDEKLWVAGRESGVYIPVSVGDSPAFTAFQPHWAEYRDNRGLKRVHPDAALWSEYTPIDCGVGTPAQKMSASLYVERYLPTVWMSRAADSLAGPHKSYSLRSTSDWMPYSWSINNVASAEMMHMALAHFRAGNPNGGFYFLRANILDQMYLGSSPANFGQISYYDAARGECYRDFGDNVGISSRALIQGLFGIVPNALDGKCEIAPGFPLDWDSVEVKTPYLIYKYKKIEEGVARIDVEQHFSRPLEISVRVNTGALEPIVYKGTDAEKQSIVIKYQEFEYPDWVGSYSESFDYELGLGYPEECRSFSPQDLSSHFNANVSDIFYNQYLSPRPATTTLQIPVQGVGEWCHPKHKPEINDSVFRSLAVGDRFEINGIPFSTPQVGKNIIYTSLWDNYPSSVTIPVKAQKSRAACLLLAGSTNHMQTHIENALVIANYADGSTDTLRLIPPFNWCPIEQDYYVDGGAFRTVEPRPVRISFGTGIVSCNLGSALGIKPTEVYGREIKGGAGQMLVMPLNDRKKVCSFTLTTLSNDVVVGVMGITLIK